MISLKPLEKCRKSSQTLTFKRSIHSFLFDIPGPVVNFIFGFLKREDEREEQIMEEKQYHAPSKSLGRKKHSFLSRQSPTPLLLPPPPSLLQNNNQNTPFLPLSQNHCNYFQSLCQEKRETTSGHQIVLMIESCSMNFTKKNDCKKICDSCEHNIGVLTV